MGPAEAIGGWTVVPSPNPSEQGNYLTAVESISPNDVWAVGTAYRPTSTAGTLIEHWQGSSWSVVPSPNGSGGYNELFAVDAVSSSDAWAGGYVTYGEDTLVLRRQDA